MADIGKIFAEYSQKTARPGPARRNFGPAQSTQICGPERPGPARPDLSSLGFTNLVIKVPQAGFLGIMEERLFEIL